MPRLRRPGPQPGRASGPGSGRQELLEETPLGVLGPAARGVSAAGSIGTPNGSSRGALSGGHRPCPEPGQHRARLKLPATACQHCAWPSRPVVVAAAGPSCTATAARPRAAAPLHRPSRMYPRLMGLPAPPPLLRRFGPPPKWRRPSPAPLVSEGRGRSGGRPAPSAATHPPDSVGRGAWALGARGAKKLRPRLGRGALQKFWGAEVQNSIVSLRYQTHFHEAEFTTCLHCQSNDVTVNRSMIMSVVLS